MAHSHKRKGGLTEMEPIANGAITDAAGFTAGAVHAGIKKDGRSLDLRTGRRMTENRGIVATPAVLHEAVLDAVEEVLGG